MNRAQLEHMIGKLIAHREKDLQYARAAIKHRLAHRETLRARLEDTDVADEVRTAVRSEIDRI